MKNIIGKFGYKITKLIDPDYFEDFLDIYNFCKPFTMTSMERIFAIYNSIEYLTKNEIKGSIVECGVWKGGSIMAAAKSLIYFDDTSRDLYLYDTYEGMSEPTVNDIDFKDNKARELLEKGKKRKQKDAVWAYSTINEVKNNLFSTKYPMSKMKFIKGMVEDTIPKTIPNQIALLRLDTDWYKSTYHELEHLFPLLCEGGVLIVDDYGHWKGAKKAVDEYFNQNDVPILLNRIDYSGRIGVKQTVNKN